MKNSLFKIFKSTRKTFAGHGLGKYEIVQKTSNWLGKKLHPSYIVYGGHKFFLDKHDSIHYSYSDETENYSEDVSLIIEKACQKNSIVIDVGANIGWYTLQYARYVGSTGKIFAFEPVKENFQLLKKNISKNGYENIIPINKAVSNEVSTVKMELSDRIGDHRIVNDVDSTDKTIIEVDCTTLDNSFPHNTKIDFLKIDAEGQDLNVLLGAKRLIDENPQIVIFVEFNPFLLRQNNIEPIKLLEFLESHNFQIYDEEKNPSQQSLVSELIKYDDGKSYSLTNLICIRNKMHSD
jgi:FkbM family methyltransferase